MEYATIKSDDWLYIFILMKFESRGKFYKKIKTDERGNRTRGKEKSGKIGAEAELGLGRGTIIILYVLHYRDFCFTYPNGSLLILIIIMYIQQINSK